MFKKLLQSLLVVLLVLLSFSKTSFIYADDEEEDVYTQYNPEEEDDDEGCEINGSHFSLQECNDMYDEARKGVSQIEKEIFDAQNNKEKQEALAEQYALQAQSLQSDIDELSTQIEELKARIDVLVVQIQENEKKVEELNSRVKDRMVAYQKTMHFNGYLEFILGSKSFTDMLSRVYGVEAVVSKDKADREEYISVITQLNADKQELDDAKATLDESYQELVVKQEELKAMEVFYREQAAQIQIELDRMNEEKDSIYDSFSEIAKAIGAVGVVSSSGFVSCVHNSWISETVWNYSPDFLDGEWHLGIDYAASRYEKIHAPANGVIVRSNEVCADVNKSRLYDPCGIPLSGGGNQVYMMCEVNGKVYGFIFMHMNTIYVDEGDYVLQDDVIGLVGSSGKSTGPHCHIEMYELGSGTLSEFLDMSWNATWSCGRGSTAYSNRCYYDSDHTRRQSSPCILNPEWYLPE